MVLNLESNVYMYIKSEEVRNYIIDLRHVL